ncbi:MAG: T9SS type A sorting domain-containing protein, partial [Chitinophagaceae bacterium]
QDGYVIADNKIRTGFVAQEVEKTAAQIGYDFDGINHPQNEKDNYSLVYGDFVPSLVKAVQEQQQIIGDLQKQIDELKTLVTNLSQGQQPAFNNQQLTTIPGLILEQNIPNPLNNSASIGYFIPNNLPNGLLIVTDMNGKTMKQIALQPGKGNVTIDASTLSAGAYNYMLMINGAIVASKKMVVTH